MADHAHSPEEASPGSMPSPSSGAFIAKSRNFTISGGNFTNIVTNAPVVPSDFRTIPLGDVDLRNMIRLDDYGMVNRQRGLCSARRVYNARIEGTQSDMTVAVYQGENAEETWKLELEKYTGLRHPNIVQLYGAVNSGGLYAMIFHGDLVPFKHFMEDYRHSVISTVYLYGFFTTELTDADQYFKSLVGGSRWLNDESISWIRCSTGRLCLEVAPNIADRALLYPSIDSLTSHIPLSSLGPDPEMSIISSLTLDQFHIICYWYLSTWKHLPMLDKMHLGAIVSQTGESTQEVAYIPNASFRDSGWTRSSFDDAPTHMENGWSRVHSFSVNGMIPRTIWHDTDPNRWLSQANYIFSQLATPPKHEDCFLIYGIYYQLSFSGPLENLPEGYLFLCPLEDLRDNDGNFLRNPECLGYWSLNPSGIQRLSPEEASSLGFPSLELKMEVTAISWDESVYAALSRFHAGKGFDPNSQDIAQHLEYPLYELSSSLSDDSARFEEVSSDPSGAPEPRFPPASSSPPPELILTPATPSPEILVPNVPKKRARDEVDPSNILDTSRIRKKPKQPDA